MYNHIYLGLGSNMGDRGQNISQALSKLREKIAIKKISYLYESDPVGMIDQPRFLNAACCGLTTLSPEELYIFTEEIMQALGRMRVERFGPRTIDIDILFYNDDVLHTEHLVIPHPRLHERAFVLQPLVDIDPHLVHPVLGQSMQELLMVTSGPTPQKVTPIGDMIWKWGSATYTLAIMNNTPDSFSGDGLSYASDTDIITRAREIVLAEADCIDIGGMSTRPGHTLISEDEELQRVVRAVKLVRAHFNIPISVDTFRSSVAREALQAGANMINSVAGFHYDRTLANVVRAYGVPVIITDNRQKNKYLAPLPETGGPQSIVEKVTDALANDVQEALDLGILPWNIIVDPGIGFGKNVEENLELTEGLSRLKTLGLPLLYGASRKGFLRSLVGKEKNEDLVAANLAIATIAALHGADIIRVHDVKESKDALIVRDAFRKVIQ